MTFTATVTPTPTAGTVQFAIDGTPSGNADALSGGVATLSSSGLSPGTHQITATYSGSANFEPSAASITQQIDAPPPPADHSGYWMVGVDGKVFAFGAVPNLGGIAAGDVVDLEPTRRATAIGSRRAAERVSLRRRAELRRCTRSARAGERVVSMSTLPGNNGYWLFTDSGGSCPSGRRRSSAISRPPG